MSNNYVPTIADLLAGELARANDINTRYGYLVSGFDKLPAPLASGQGFSDPVPVGTPTLDTHAVPKSVMNAAETGVITNKNATAASAAAALVSENNAATSATNAAASSTTAGTSEVAAVAAKTAAETAETASVAAKTSAETAEAAALVSKNSATASATAASVSATNAAASESSVVANTTAAQTAATNAAASESSATASQSAAATSATAASTSESAAATSATASATSATASQTAKTASETAKTGAETAQAAALVSQNAAASSVTAAATSATAAAGSATASSGSATSSATSATDSANSLTSFNAKYLGASATVPSGTAAGQLYFNTTSNTMFVYSGSSWAAAGSAVNGTAERQEYTATSGQTSFNATYDVGFVDVYLNGSKLIPTTDFTATNGSQVVLISGAALGDNVSIIAYGAFNVADVYTQSQSNARYMQLANNLSDVASAPTALTNLGLTADAAEINKLDGMTASKAELNYLSGVTSNIQTQINNVGGGNEASFVASGAISSKAPVILKSDGKAAAVAQTTISQSVGTPQEIWNYVGEQSAMCYDHTNNCVVYAFADSNNSNYRTIMCGTVNGATKQITWDTANKLVFDTYNGASPYMSLVYSVRAGNPRVAVFYRGATDYGYVRVISISGTTPSVTGAAQRFSNQNIDIQNLSACIDDTNSATSKVMLTYNEWNGSAQTFYARMFTVGSSSCSYGNSSSPATVSDPTVSVWDSVSEKFILFYRAGGNNYYGAATVATLSNDTTIASFGGGTVWHSANVYLYIKSAAYDVSSGKSVVAFRDYGQSSYGKAIALTLSSGTLSYGGASATTFNASDTRDMGVAYDPTAEKIVVAYYDRGGGNPTYGKVVTLATNSSDYTITVSSPTTFFTASGAAADGYTTTYDPDAQKVIVGYKNATTSDLESIVVQAGYDSTNLTSTNFLGFADAAISDGASGAVILEGAVIEGLSSLTIGSTYYILPTGALSTSAGTPSVTAGMAISATSINMRGAT